MYPINILIYQSFRFLIMIIVVNKRSVMEIHDFLHIILHSFQVFSQNWRCKIIITKFKGMFWTWSFLNVLIQWCYFSRQRWTLWLVETYSYITWLIYLLTVISTCQFELGHLLTCLILDIHFDLATLTYSLDWFLYQSTFHQNAHLCLEMFNQWIIIIDWRSSSIFATFIRHTHWLHENQSFRWIRILIALIKGSGYSGESLN